MKDINIARQILRVRLGQMLINEKYKRGRFKIPIHLAFGHEAIAVAVDAVMKKEDQLVLSHRNIHYNLARISSLRPVLDEYLLNKKGLAQGRLGSMNLANERKNIVHLNVYIKLIGLLSSVKLARSFLKREIITLGGKKRTQDTQIVIFAQKGA